MKKGEGRRKKKKRASLRLLHLISFDIKSLQNVKGP
jgi:hypothetical protein